VNLRLLPLAVECAVSLALARVGMRLAPRRLLREAMSESGGAAVDPRVVAVFARVAARVPFGHNCVHRALALQRVLARRGMGARMRIGIGQKPQVFPGHAWLEANGAIINDHPEHVSRYTPLGKSLDA